MNRRALLRSLGVAGAAAIAGCSSDGSEPSGEQPQPPNPGDDVGNGSDGVRATTPPDPVPNIDYTTWNLDETDDGKLVISVTVENVASQVEHAVLVVDLRVADEEMTREKAISLGAKAKKTYSFQFPTTRDRFMSDGALDVHMEPATEGGG